MKLKNLGFGVNRNLREGYAKVLNMPGQYGNWHVDPKPSVVQLGTWVHPSTRNTLVAGINKNY